MAFYGSTRNSLYAILSAIITPMLLTAFTWVLYKLGSLYLQFYTSNKEEKTRETNPPPNLDDVGANERIQLVEHPEAQMEEGMAGTAPDAQDYQSM